MNHRISAPARGLSLASLAFLLSSPSWLGAQPPQVNTPQATLSINGTGRVVNNSGVVAGSAPLYHHHAAARVPLEIGIDGLPGQPFILAISMGIAGVPVPTPGGALELDLNQGFSFLLNGFAPTTPLSWSATTGPSGSWSLVLPGGLPPGAPTFYLQAAVADPTAAPHYYRLTASIAIEVGNDLDTYGRNLTDSVVEAPRNPAYLQGMLASGFASDGLSATEFVAELMGYPLISATFVGIGKNTTDPAAPPVPAGAPPAGADVPLSLELAVMEPSGCGFPATGGGHFRLYDQRFVEEGGVWKWGGNQREVELDVDLKFTPGSNQGLTVCLDVWLEDVHGRYGGISSVVISGPQLAQVVGGQALTSQSGPQGLNPEWQGIEGSEWSLTVELGGAGTSSRMPWVERIPPAMWRQPDQYDVTITWNDQSPTTGHAPVTYHALTLRAALDPDVNPGAVVAALPTLASGPGVPAPALSNPSAWNASISLTLNLGASTPSGLFSSMHLDAYQLSTNIGVELGDLPITSIANPQLLTICSPFMQAGAGHDIVVSWAKEDIFGSTYEGYHQFQP